MTGGFKYSANELASNYIPKCTTNCAVTCGEALRIYRTFKISQRAFHEGRLGLPIRSLKRLRLDG